MNGEAVLLVVEDTGIGIAAGDQQRIFQEFVQLDNPQRSRDKGVGLGLAIVHHISLLLMHEVAVESAPGQGTRISVLLPRANSGAPLPSASSPRVPELDLTGRQVWIIEDDASVRDALDVYFRQRQCNCVTARSSR